MSAGFWSTHFGWPDGDVWGNLIASAVCFALAALPLRALWRRHTAKHAETHRLLRELHARLDGQENKT